MGEGLLPDPKANILFYFLCCFRSFALGSTGITLVTSEEAGVSSQGFQAIGQTLKKEASSSHSLTWPAQMWTKAIERKWAEGGYQSNRSRWVNAVRHNWIEANLDVSKRENGMFYAEDSFRNRDGLCLEIQPWTRAKMVHKASILYVGLWLWGTQLTPKLKWMVYSCFVCVFIAV